MITIQKYYRRWLAQRFVCKVKQDKEDRIQWEIEEELKKKQEKEHRIRHEYERRMNPKSKQDFDLLYHALESMFSYTILCIKLIIIIDHASFPSLLTHATETTTFFLIDLY